MNYRFGTAQGNYLHIEDLLPGLNLDHIMEDDIIQFLLEDYRSRSAMVLHLKFYQIPGRRCIWLHHKQLIIPLLYEMGEGDEGFEKRLRLRQEAGKELGMVC